MKTEFQYYCEWIKKWVTFIKYPKTATIEKFKKLGILTREINH